MIKRGFACCWVVAVCAVATGAAARVESPAGPAILGDAPEAPPPTAGAPGRHSIRLTAEAAAPLVVDISKREEARRFFNTVYRAAEGADANWTGNRANCDAGATDPAFRNLVALRINYYRAMAGVSAGIVFDEHYSDQAQQAALMMSVNGALSHSPAENWACYSAAGAAGAVNGNLALGQYGPAAITGYMQDFGDNNFGVGHRRWLLYPQTRLMGTGDVPFSEDATAANSVWVFDGNYGAVRPPTREAFVSWPPPGFVPYQLVFTRWSFSFPDADFSTASVTVTSNGVPTPVVLETFKPNVGEASLVWYAAGLDGSGEWTPAAPASDVAYNVTINGVQVAGKPRSFTYTVKAFDPAVAGADAQPVVPSGSAQPAVGGATTYLLPAVGGAVGYEWRQATASPLAGVVEGAETGLGAFTGLTAPGYAVRMARPQPGAGNRYCFHLAHPEPASDQTLTCQRAVLPGANGKLLFKSRLGYATASEVARVEVSLDEGGTWRALYAQAGDDSAGEQDFVARQVRLDEFAGRILQVRFNYHFSQGMYFTDTDDRVGWLIDDVGFQDCEEFHPAAITAAVGNNFTFTPVATTTVLLQSRALVWGGIPTEWGPVLRVVPTTTPLGQPTVTLVRHPILVGGQLQLEFAVAAYRPGLIFRLLKLATVDAAGLVEPGAVLETVEAGKTFRFKTQPPPSRAFYRVAVE